MSPPWPGPRTAPRCLSDRCLLELVVMSNSCTQVQLEFARSRARVDEFLNLGALPPHRPASAKAYIPRKVAARHGSVNAGLTHADQTSDINKTK